MELGTQKMQVLQFNLKFLTFAGCWTPVSWTSWYKRTVYNIYTIFISSMLVTFVVPQFLDIILNVDNANDFTDTFYVMLATTMGSCKMFGLLLNRKNIGILTDALAERPFKPIEPNEIEIRRKFDNMIQTNTMWYVIAVELTCASMTVGSLFTDFRKGNLAYREWTPYEVLPDIVFYITYFRQLIGLTAASIVNLACDCLICGFLIHICCQFDILENRLKNHLRNQKDLSECVRQHDRIYKFAYTVNEKFSIVIAIQFAVSTMVVCSSLYQIMETTASEKYASLLLYVFCMTVQILIYCWYGNEVKLKSMQVPDRIFEMDWHMSNNNIKRDLIVIMSRSLVPIEFSSAHILTLNLDSFGKLLKASYSVFNILH